MRRAFLAAALAALATVAVASGAGPVYGLDPRASTSAVEARAIQRIRARLGGSARAPSVSGALVRAARELAGRAAAGDPDAISHPHVRGALARALGYDAAPLVLLAAGAPEEVADAVARAVPRNGATHVGAGAVERDGKTWVVALLADRRVVLDPFPRDLASGARAVLSGELAAPLSRARVFVARPSGAVAEVGGSGPGRRFRAALHFAERGRHVVEVVAEGAGGPEVAAILTVAVGGARLDPPPVAAARPEPEDRAAAEAGVLSALNDTRRRHGLRPISPAAALADVARRHSEAMAAAGRVAHVVPGSGDVGARLIAARVPYRRVLENVARAGTSLGAHATAEESPAHLSNVLCPEVTRVGIGIARARLPSGDATVYLTEIFVEPPDDGSDSHLTPEARVREALWRERARLGLRPLTADAALDAIARDAARGMRARDETEAGGVADRALALRRSVAAVDVFVASAPGEAVRSANLRDGRFQRVGVGIASGDSRRFGTGRLWIAVVYTD